MPHAPPFGRRESCDIAYDWLRHVVARPSSSFRLLRTTDLADHDNGRRLRIILEALHMVAKGTAVDGIAADADAGRDAQAQRRQLRRRLVAKSARARYDTDIAASVNVPRHDAEHRLARTDDTGAVRAHERRAPLARIAQEVAFYRHHVLCRYAIGNDADEPQACVRRLHEAVSGKRRRNKGKTRIRAGRLYRLLDRIKHRSIKMTLSALAGRDAAYYVGAVGKHFAGVKSRLFSSESLNDDSRGRVDQNAHAALRAAATAFAAASARLSAVIIGKPLSRRILRPSSTLVPARRTTSGTRSPRAACTTPCATQSQRLMPANMLTSMAFTPGSASTKLNADATRSGDAPPPTSRKFAGSPPAYLIMSIVAMAKPAPLMMQPISPSRLTKLRPIPAASDSRGSSSAVSRISAICGRRNRALSLSLIHI